LALSVQVLQAFYVQATRVTRPDPIAHDLAVGLIRRWLRFEVQAITVPVMINALQIKRLFACPIGTRRSSRPPGPLAAAKFCPRT
jgi:hypothetical protein